MQRRRVVITGLGAITPLGNTAQEFGKNLFEGKSGAGPVTHFDASKFKTRFACEVKGFNPQEYFERKEVRKMDLFTQYGMVSATEAVNDSGIDIEKIDPRR